MLLVLASCGPSKKGIFADKRTDHQKYADKIREAGLDKTSMGKQWLEAARQSLTKPLNISLPYKETGYFAPERPSAAGLIFNARRGDRLTVSLSVVPDTIHHFFAELWQPGNEGQEPQHLASVDSTRNMVHDVEEDGTFIVRFQPPLLEAAEYTVTINTGPSLAFPVSESGNPRLISFWSDPRDGGRRSHEGVDISAKFRTPAVASANGRVHRVMENRLGGKVVFMRPEGKNYSLYYAHLDSQIVSTGAKVKKGQVLGLVGNTGNAKGTVPHLHFGIYTFGGAIDPLPFIDPRRKSPPEVLAPKDEIGQWIRTTRNTRLSGVAGAMNDSTLQVEKGAVVEVLAAADSRYKVRLPNGSEGFVRLNVTSTTGIENEKAITSVRILNNPDASAAAVAKLSPNDAFEVLGRFGAFQLVRSGDVLGWIEAD